ncbi:MAG: glutamate--tRNA ligase, partial [Deltaproteobacteria bacterium]|nr:glutamate--tRNA ligase [Deltaproteobacteria bacterium]
IEDTDQSRKVDGAVENLITSLNWAGIDFDEGIGKGGDHGPYYQSQRLDIYRKYIDQLMDQGDAYPCFCTTEDLEAMRTEQILKKQPPRYDGRCRRLTKAESQEKLKQNIPYVCRMKVIHSRGNYQVKDLIRGNVSFKPSQIDDQVLMKSDGFPTYHLASVVDDHLMNITHVIRGEEWLPSTPKHLQIYEYLGWEPPLFAHLPLLLNPDRSKLSKRQGDVATEDFREKGYLPECMINFVALLGWNTSDTKEIFSLEELIGAFSLERVGKAGAIFDIAKLNWMNQQYFKQTPIDEMMGLLKPYLPAEIQAFPLEQQKKMVAVVRDSMMTLPDVKERLALFLLEKPEFSAELDQKMKSPEAQSIFNAFLEKVQPISELNSENFLSLMKEVQKETGIKGKQLWGPMRIAVTLVEQGPELPLVVEILGKQKCVNRIKSLIL